MKLIALLGRPNAGKSTLFNRLTGVRLRERALVAAAPGTTRDVRYGTIELPGNVRAQLADCGGVEHGRRTGLSQLVSAAAARVAQRAHLVLFLVDGAAPDAPNAADDAIANFVRRSASLRARTLLCVSKVDNVHSGGVSPSLRAALLRYGLAHEPIAFSALHGANVDALCEEMAKRLERSDETADEAAETTTATREAFSLALVGQPNAGKSSLFNCMCGEARALVDAAPGTTADPVDTLLRIASDDDAVADDDANADAWMRIVDTAGLRRARLHERASAARAAQLWTASAVERADVVALVVDATRGVTREDKRIAAMALAAHKSLLVLVNKFDLVRAQAARAKDATLADGEAWRRGVRDALPFAPELVVCLTSAARRCAGVAEATRRALDVYRARVRRVPTRVLTRALQSDAATVGGSGARLASGALRVAHVAQTGTSPPTFVVFVNHAASRVPRAVERHYAALLRRVAPRPGTPLRVIIRQKT